MTIKSPTMTAPWQRLGKKLQMGLRACAEKDWLLTPDHFGDDDMHRRQLALKQELSQTHHAAIFDATPDSIDASLETVDLIQNNLAAHHGIELKPDETRHPLDAAALQIPEDVLLLAPQEMDNGTVWILKAASLAFPSHWVLAEKMNLPMAAIHTPVPGYGDVLAGPVDRFFTAMLKGPISQRRNWALQIDDGLFTPSRFDHAPITTDEIASRLFVRVERQTLRKLPVTGWIIFTIQTAIAPIGIWQDDQPALDDLAALIAAMTPAERDYRGVNDYLQQLLDWVEASTE